MFPGTPSPYASGSNWAAYRVQGRGADLIAQMDLLAGDRLFAGAHDAHRPWQAHTGNLWFDKTSYELVQQQHRGQLNGFGSTLTFHGATVSASERSPGLIHVRGGGLAMTSSLMSGNIVSEGAPVMLNDCRILGDVTLDHGDLQIDRTRIEGTLALRADSVRIGRGCHIRHLKLDGTRGGQGVAATATLRIVVDPGAVLDRVASTHPFVFYRPDGVPVQSPGLGPHP